MFKNWLKFPLITNECEDLFSCVSTGLLIESKYSMMSSNNSYLNEEEVENILKDIEEIIRTPPTSENQTVEDIDHILQIEESLINCGPISPSHTSNDSFGQSEELLLNPCDQNLIDPLVNPFQQIMEIPTNPSRDLMQLPYNATTSPESPVTNVTRIINSLDIKHRRSSETFSPSFISQPIVENNTHLSIDSSVGVSQMEPYFETPILSHTTSPPMPIRPTNRGGHSTQVPYTRSFTDPLPFNPLPGFNRAFRHNTFPQVSPNTSLPLLGSPTDTNAMSPQSSQSLDFPFSSIEHRSWSSEPVLPPVIRGQEYTRSPTNHRGRPFSRPQMRRPPTARERREQLENELTAQEITHYELDTRYRYLYSATQYFKNKLRECGYSQNQLKAIMAQMETRCHPRHPTEGFN